MEILMDDEKLLKAVWRVNLYIMGFPRVFEKMITQSSPCNPAPRCKRCTLRCC